MANEQEALILNLQQLKYVLAIQREGSITKAAHALFRAQPNLSSALRELEEELHITIFNRTPAGVELTPQGEEFITYAANILTQIERIENIYREPVKKEVSIGISVSRASYCSQALSQWMNAHISPELPLSLYFHETNTDRVIEQVFTGESNLGVIRIPSFYENYYRQLLEHKDLRSCILMEFRMLLVMRKDHPLAYVEDISFEELCAYTEVVHGDHRNPTMTMSRINPLLNQVPQRRIYVYDRGSQIDLLKTIPGSYMWVSPIPWDVLQEAGMVIRTCSLSTVCNQDYLIWHKRSLQDPVVQSCADYLKEYAASLSRESMERLGIDSLSSPQ